MPEPLTLTEEELQAKIDEAVKKAVTETTTALTKEHNQNMGMIVEQKNNYSIHINDLENRLSALQEKF